MDVSKLAQYHLRGGGGGAALRAYRHPGEQRGHRLSAARRNAWRKATRCNGWPSTSRDLLRLPGRGPKGMISRKKGRIINISSQAGFRRSSHRIDLLHGPRQPSPTWTKCLALEWAPQQHHGEPWHDFIQTPGTRRWLDDAAFRESVIRRIPLGRVGDVAEVAAPVVFLALSCRRPSSPARRSWWTAAGRYSNGKGTSSSRPGKSGPDRLLLGRYRKAGSTNPVAFHRDRVGVLTRPGKRSWDPTTTHPSPSAGQPDSCRGPFHSRGWCPPG